jgi:lipopolysaccharide assembly outer membrane protein LptD (OstA)
MTYLFLVEFSLFVCFFAAEKLKSNSLSMLSLYEKNLKLEMPQVNDEGRITSLLTAEVATKMDDEKVWLEKMQMRVYQENQSEDMVIDVPEAFFEVSTNRMLGQGRITLKSETVLLEGDLMKYDMNQQKVFLHGRIKTTLKN